MAVPVGAAIPQPPRPTWRRLYGCGANAMAENSNGQLRDGSNSAHLESPDSVPRPTLRPGNESITSYLVPVRWARTVEVFDGWVDLKRCKVLRVGRWWALYRTPLGGFLEYVYIPSIPEYAYFVGKARASRWFKFNPELAPAELWPYLGMVDLTEAPIDFIDAPADHPELVADAAPSGNGTAATNGRAPEASAELTATAPQSETVENRALAMALRMITSGEKLSIVTIAKTLGCQRSFLYRCPKFQAFIKAQKDRRGSLPRGRKDRKTRELEAWDSGD